MTSAKDIPDLDMLRAIYDSGGTGEYKWAMRWDVSDRLAAYHPKVVYAKFYQLKKRGLADGCECGCRGDYHVTPKGADLLAGKATDAQTSVVKE